MAVVFATDTDDDGTGTTGTIHNNAWKQAMASAINTAIPVATGTWTPVIGGSGGTSGQVYGTQSGTYARAGDIVLAQFFATLTTKGTITGSVEIQGLPILSLNSASAYNAAILQFTALGTNWVHLFALMQPNSQAALVRGCQAAALTNSTGLTTADITNTTSLIGTILYRA